MTLKGPWEFTEPACAQVGITFFYLKDLDDPDQGMEEGNYLLVYIKLIVLSGVLLMKPTECGVA
jgi:hypothetical protein